MPLFKRPDGDLISDLSNVRRFLPYLLRGRNESAVYHEQTYDLTKTRPWIRNFNRKNDQAATLFHLIVYAYARTLHVMHQRAGEI